MKNIIFRTFVVLSSAIFLTSCETEMKDYNIIVLANTNLVEGMEEPIPSKIKELLEPKEHPNGKIVFIPKLSVLRNDLSGENKMEIKVPISMENKLRKKMGTYTYVDLKLDYEEFLPKMTAGDFLAKKGNITNNTNNLKINSNDLVFIISSSNTNEPNYFPDIKSLKIKLDSILIAEGKSFSKNVYIKYEKDQKEQNLIRIGKLIIKAPIEKPNLGNPCSENTIASAFDLREDMLKIVNAQLSSSERNELAIKVWNKYFDESAYVATYISKTDNNPEIWNPGQGKQYFTHRIAILESITDINIFRVETSTQSGKISGIKIIECHNASEAI
ncbi:hypothetical protein [uncultured Lutibacter sp.]|uniref:hypothetical protein n=1 Tax=uncultured Lutibacter sp. TaxID=437739 RepID=UPI002634C437|nr:hypothetical protein [uncultured Lutibacter sp.]